MTDSKSTNEKNSAKDKTTVSKAKKKVVSKKAETAATKKTQTVPANTQKPMPNNKTSQSAPKTEQKVEQKTEIKQPAVSNSPQVETKVVEVKKGGGALAGLALLLSLGALAGVGYTWYQTQLVGVQKETSLAVGVTEIGGQVSRIGDNVARLQQQQDNIVSEDKLSLEIQKISQDVETKISSLNLDNRFSELNQSQANAQQAVEQLHSDLKQGVNAYAIEEVSQLLKLANQSIIFARNPDTAASALSLADLQLQGLNDPRYSSVRVKIAEEISSLESVERVDIEGLSAKLTAMSSLIPSLPLANEPDVTNVDLPDTEAATESGWEYEAASLWNEIKSSIQVQRVDQAPKPLLAPEQRYFLNQNLQLSLKTAQLALLQEQSDVFKINIESANQWLQDYFDMADTRVADVMDELSTMSQEQIALSLPSITESYETLQNIRGGQ